MILKTPAAPYYAVIFTSVRNGADAEYDFFNQETDEQVKTIDGYLGNEALRNEQGFGIHVSYWKDMDAINTWKNNILHQRAKQLGKEKWYKGYAVRICKVEHESLSLHHQ